MRMMARIRMSLGHQFLMTVVKHNSIVIQHRLHVLNKLTFLNISASEAQASSQILLFFCFYLCCSWLMLPFWGDIWNCHGRPQGCYRSRGAQLPMFGLIPIMFLLDLFWLCFFINNSSLTLELNLMIGVFWCPLWHLLRCGKLIICIYVLVALSWGHCSHWSLPENKRHNSYCKKAKCLEDVVNYLLNFSNF